MSASETLEFWKLFRPSACSLNLKAGEPEGIFDEILANMVKGKVLDPSLQGEARAALLEREKTGSTGVGRNVAIPHVQIAGLETASVSISLHQEGVDWRALDGAPAQVFFTVLRPAQPSEKHDPERHLEMMRWIANLGRHEDFRRFALSVKTRTELVDLLKEMSGA